MARLKRALVMWARAGGEPGDCTFSAVTERCSVRPSTSMGRIVIRYQPFDCGCAPLSHLTRYTGSLRNRRTRLYLVTADDVDRAIKVHGDGIPVPIHSVSTSLDYLPVVDAS